MNLDLGKFLKRLDYVCFVFAVVGAIPLIAFEFTSISYFFKTSLIFFLITFILLTLVLILRLVTSKKYADNQDFSLKTSEKVRYSIFLILCTICVVWVACMLILL